MKIKNITFILRANNVEKESGLLQKESRQKLPDGRHLGSRTVMRARICLRPGVALTKQSALERERGGGAIHTFYKIHQNKKRNL